MDKAQQDLRRSTVNGRYTKRLSSVYSADPAMAGMISTSLDDPCGPIGRVAQTINPLFVCICHMPRCSRPQSLAPGVDCSCVPWLASFRFSCGVLSICSMHLCQAPSSQTSSRLRHGLRARTYDARSSASTDEGPTLRAPKALFCHIIVVPDTQARYACVYARLTRPCVVHASSSSPRPLALQADTRAEKLKLELEARALLWT